MDSLTSTQTVLKNRYHKDILKNKEIAEFLDVSVGTISNMVKDNKIPYLKLGNGSKTSSIRFEVAAISQWIDNMNNHTSKGS